MLVRVELDQPFDLRLLAISVRMQPANERADEIFDCYGIHFNSQHHGICPAAALLS